MTYFSTAIETSGLDRNKDEILELCLIPENTVSPLDIENSFLFNCVILHDPFPSLPLASLDLYISNGLLLNMTEPDNYKSSLQLVKEIVESHRLDKGFKPLEPQTRSVLLSSFRSLRVRSYEEATVLLYAYIYLLTNFFRNEYSLTPSVTRPIDKINYQIKMMGDSIAIFTLPFIHSKNLFQLNSVPKGFEFLHDIEICTYSDGIDPAHINIDWLSGSEPILRTKVETNRPLEYCKTTIQLLRPHYT
ncbi:hypothetical protein C3I27_04070 [Campylobacter jejuni]|uniref:Uncharacterized protein n=1 Tax=Campylobacter jejuni TaxID=197 RepID=A0AAX1Z4F1_CAMJU|nr:hypothetical protein [Campylobacter jejuni]RTI48604.1 hypothetical protein C3I27_04070 [Campylobacter jejuni]